MSIPWEKYDKRKRIGEVTELIGLRRCINSAFTVTISPTTQNVTIDTKS